jgi:hypothetical protein
MDSFLNFVEKCLTPVIWTYSKYDRRRRRRCMDRRHRESSLAPPEDCEVDCGRFICRQLSSTCGLPTLTASSRPYPRHHFRFGNLNLLPSPSSAWPLSSDVWSISKFSPVTQSRYSGRMPPRCQSQRLRRALPIESAQRARPSASKPVNFPAAVLNTLPMRLAGATQTCLAFC